MEFVANIIIMASIYAILTSSLNLLVGFTGLAALGHIGFAAIGAYSSAILSSQLGLQPWVSALLAAPLLASITALAIGVLVLKLRGDYFALATFGFGAIVHAVAKNWVNLTRGPFGIPGIPSLSVLGVSLSIPSRFVLVAVPIAVCSIVALGRVAKSHFGQVLLAIREDDVAAEVIGYDTAARKLIAFVIAASFAGLAGALYAHYISFIDPTSFSTTESLAVLLMVVFGGLASIPGSVTGALVLVAFPELLRLFGMPSSVSGPLRQILYGLLLIAVVMWWPRGLLGRIGLDE